MSVELITREDLEQFKKELFEELKQGGSRPSQENQKWLKSYQVKNLLKISPGTLQNLRMTGTLRFTKIGGILYYKQEDILQVLEGKPKEESQSSHPDYTGQVRSHSDLSLFLPDNSLFIK